MKTKAVLAAVTAAVLAMGSTAAFARPGDDRGPDRHQDRRYDNDRGARHDHRSGPRQWHGQDRRHAAPVVRHAPPRHAQWRGAGPRHDIYVGTRLPAYYRGPVYVVNDWRAHRLAVPPRGYHWVQTGADYVLIAVASGIIAQIVLGQ